MYRHSNLYRKNNDAKHLFFLYNIRNKFSTGGGIIIWINYNTPTPPIFLMIIMLQHGEETLTPFIGKRKWFHLDLFDILTSIKNTPIKKHDSNNAIQRYDKTETPRCDVSTNV